MRSLRTNWAVLFVTCAFPMVGSAQMDYFIASSFGSRFNDVNDNGIAVSGGAYFDFATEVWTPMENGTTEMVSINNAGDVAGSMWFDEANFIFQPAYKRNGVWNPIGWFPGSDPQTSSFTTYSISPNGVWVTGQMSMGCCDFGTFRYNTDTQVLTEIFSPDYVAVAGYVITNDGTIGGWADDEGLGGGTHRIPVYITPDLDIIPVSPQVPQYNVNAVTDINSAQLMVGDVDNQPFIYDRIADTFTTFDIPAGYLSATFTSVSDNGVAVGYAQQFGEFGSLLRDALIYHPNLGNQPVFLKDILLANGVDINAPSGRMGTAYAISQSGEYVAGWDDQAPFSANGWVVHFDGLLLTGTGLGAVAMEAPVISVYPNPASYVLTIGSTTTLEAVTVFNAQGQEVIRQPLNNTTGAIDISAWSSGVYTLRVSTKRSSYAYSVIKD